MILVMGHLQLASGGAAALGSALKAIITATREESGCLHYAIAHDIDDADRLHVSERWRDQAALGAHLVSDHVVAFQMAMRRTRVLNADVNIYYPDGTIKRLINT